MGVFGNYDPHSPALRNPAPREPRVLSIAFGHPVTLSAGERAVLRLVPSLACLREQWGHAPAHEHLRSKRVHDVGIARLVAIALA